MRTWCNPTLESLIDLAGQGDVVPLSGFGVPFYVLCHPSPIEEVLRQKSRLFRKDAYLDALRPMLGNGLFTSEGNEWRRQRAAAQPQFAARQIQQYAGTMVEYADRLISGWKFGETRDIHAEMMGLTLDIVIKTLFDVEASDAGALCEELELITAHYTDPRHLVGQLRPLDAALVRFESFEPAIEDRRQDLAHQVAAAIPPETVTRLIVWPDFSCSSTARAIRKASASSAAR